MPENSFDARATLAVGGRELEIYRLDALQSRFDVARLPFSLKVLLENLLRYEDAKTVRPADIQAVAGWDPKHRVEHEVQLVVGLQAGCVPASAVPHADDVLGAPDRGDRRVHRPLDRPVLLHDR